MDRIEISGTGCTVSKNGFGALPIQRVSVPDAARLVRRAFDGGITYFDTARAYSDSESKLGIAFSEIRDRIYIATKTMSFDVSGFWEQLHTSLTNLKTDYIDFYQFHNPGFVPRPGDSSGLYDAMLEAKAQGKIRHIGITNHRLAVADEALGSGLYEIIQYPFNFLSSGEEIDFVRRAAEKRMTVVAMKALSGGLITNSKLAYAYLRGFPNVLPIWGVQRDSELSEFLSYHDAPPELDGELAAELERDKKELAGDFCRGCGYCQPCPAGIEIPTAARMRLLLRRSPNAALLSDDWAARMENIENCLHCGHCTEHCPYKLDTPALLRDNLLDYREFRLLNRTAEPR
ncbi:MAG: aldo/keto reductase [Oscillospiraceae bacterium]|nr:aldo/keto reductase [Oscillospiraceae bacterium]